MIAFTRLVLLCSLAVPFFAQAEDNDPCGPVFKACAAQGFEKDETSPAGKKIWLNCADPIVNGGKKVAKVDMDPKSWDAKNCHDFREARAKFETDWVQNHKKTK